MQCQDYSTSVSFTNFLSLLLVFHHHSPEKLQSLLFFATSNFKTGVFTIFKESLLARKLPKLFPFFLSSVIFTLLWPCTSAWEAKHGKRTTALKKFKFELRNVLTNKFLFFKTRKWAENRSFFLTVKFYFS